MMVRDRMVDDLLPTIIFGDFRLQHMRMKENARDILRRLKRGSFWSRVHYPMANPIKKPILEQLVQFLRIIIKMDRKSRPPIVSIPISPASVILAIVASTEKSHLVATIHQ
jgi:hypothetical protein